MHSAFKKIKKQAKIIEKLSPTIKKRGLFFFDSPGLVRPEIINYRNKFLKNYQPSNHQKILLLLPQTRKKPYHKSLEFKKIKKIIKNLSEENTNIIHACFYAAPFGIIPIELDEIYPLSQNEISFPLDYETKKYVSNQVSEYIKQTNYKLIILLNDSKNWNKKLIKSCKKICKMKKIKFEVLTTKTGINKDILACLENILKKHLSDKY